MFLQLQTFKGYFQLFRTAEYLCHSIVSAMKVINIFYKHFIGLIVYTVLTVVSIKDKIHFKMQNKKL